MSESNTTKTKDISALNAKSFPPRKSLIDLKRNKSQKINEKDKI